MSKFLQYNQRKLLPKNRNGKRIRLLVIISDLSGGGAERVVSTILQNIDRVNFEPILCLWRNKIVYPVPADVPVMILGKKSGWDIFRLIWQTRLLIKSWKPDLVYSHLDFVNMLTGLALLGKKKSIIWMPCQHTGAEYLSNRLVKQLLSIVFRRSYKVIAVSNGVRNSCFKHLSLEKDKIITIYNPLELPASRSRDGYKKLRTKAHVPTIVAVGRLCEPKDYPTLLKAVKLISKKPPIRLKILGDGPLLQELKNLAKDLGIKDCVEFSGFVSDPFSIIRESDVYAMSSIYEGLPTALIEAMACGVPVVSTRAKYGPEEIIVDGESGLLVDVGDSDGLANAILEILKNHPLNNKLSEMGALRVESLFSKDKLIPCLEDLFIKATSE
jgi:glycosyltransferase involved in cell wall biosynthesis